MRNISSLLWAFALLASLNIAAQPGIPDETFGEYNGYVVEAAVNQPHRLNNFYIQPDGKIIGIGAGNPGQSNNTGVVIRFTDTGVADVTFAVQGTSYTPTQRYFNDGAPQSDGKIVAVGLGKISTYPFTPGLLVKRCLTGGGNDTSFGTNSASFIYTAFDEGKAIAILPDDKMIIGAVNYTSSSTYTDAVMIRLNADGTIDETYGTNGSTVTDFNNKYDDIEEINITSDGKALVFGKSTLNGVVQTVVARYTADGFLDTAFGLNGKLILNDVKTNITLLENDSFFLTGAVFNGTQNNGIVTKYLSNGTIDQNFAVNGTRIFDFGFETVVGDIVVDKNGDLIACLNVDDDDNDWIVAKFNPDGILDTTFGENNGYTIFYMVPYQGFSNLMHTIRIQEDNKIVVGVYSYGFVLARFNSYPVNPNVLFTQTSKTNVSCFSEANGTATVLPLTGTAPYTYQWFPSGGTGATATGLAAGDYHVAVTDANGNTTVRYFTITQPSSFMASVTPSNIVCPGDVGGAMVTATGGVTPYTYSWTGTAAATDIVTGLTAGTYSVTVTDSAGCSVTAQTTVTAPANPLSVQVTSTPVDCANGVSGTVTASVSGGTAPYTYSWTNGGGNAPSAGGLIAGDYTVTVTDANQCAVLATATVSGPPPLEATVSVTDAGCFGTATGSASVQATGGVMPYTYAWSNGTGNTADADGLSAGIYNVLITDANGCSISEQFIVYQEQEITINTQPVANAVNTGGNALFTVAALNATGYQWQISTNGSTWQDVVNGGTQPSYSGAGTSSLQVSGIPVEANNYLYRVVLSNNSGCMLVSETALLQVSNTVQAVNDDFSAVVIYAGQGGIAGDVTTNDLLNNSPFADSQITISITGDGGPPGVTITNEGILAVPDSVLPGSYVIVYSICDAIAPSNCSEAQVTFVVQQPMGISRSNGLEANIYPNPASTQVFVELPQFTENTEIVLYDTRGRHVSRIYGSGREFNIDISAFEVGVYFLKVAVGDKQVTFKLLKN